MRHIAKPWFVDNPHDEPYYEIWQGKLGDTDRVLIAEYVHGRHAHLIAAAPKLLEACEAAELALSYAVKEMKEHRFKPTLLILQKAIVITEKT